MKSIKLKIVTWAIILMGIINPCIAQDDTTTLLPLFNLDSAIESYMDSNRQKVIITTEPLDIFIESKPVEDNEALQEMLELQIEETDSFNQNFRELNKIIRDLPYVNVDAKLDLLEHYEIDPIQIDLDYRFGRVIWYSLYIIFIFVYLYSQGKYLYFKKYKTTMIISLAIGTIMFLYVLPELFNHLFINKFYLWNNIDKLF